jgi:Ca2+-transporting ATPase
LDVEETRRTYPRVAEVPFDSEYKFMATFHRMTGSKGEPVIRCYVKGAPDVLISRGSFYRDPDGGLSATTDDDRALSTRANDELAAKGLRVMVVAERDFDPDSFRPDGNLLELVTDLTLLAMVGIVDPPRAEAKAAIASCKSAGITVRMITGDHATTAAAIGRELGLEGRALTGAEFASIPDDELLRQLPEISVIARVAPEDKVRLVRLLQRSDQIVAMTGDGVNDAPALKAANIGVAMGITGTEVSKEAAVMVLTDDNFATIVSAVEYGRALYDNLLKYLRFQMSTLVAYIAIFLGSGILNIAAGAPLTPVQILWVNMVIDIPIAVALGFDEPAHGLLRRRPRPVDAPVLSRTNWIRLCGQGLVMTIGSLAAYRLGEEHGRVVAATMLLTALSLFHLAGGLLARDQRDSILSKEAIPGPTQLRRYGIVLALIVAATGIDFLNRIVGTTALSFTQWWICIGLAAALVVVEEITKLVLRRKTGADVRAELQPALAT